jgi:hypothetical protein
MKKNEMGGACGTYMGEESFVGKHKGKRPLGRPRRRCENNIKMDLQAVGCECGKEPSGYIKCG